MLPKILTGLALASSIILSGLSFSAYAQDEKHGAYRYRHHDNDRHYRHFDRGHHRGHVPAHPIYYRHDHRPYRYYDNHSYYYQPYAPSYYQHRNDGCSFIFDSYGRIVLACN